MTIVALEVIIDILILYHKSMEKPSILSFVMTSFNF